jgi:hypothetical protein
MFTSSQHQQSRTIRRTLCIGLGGTGRDVLMQMRRLIIDRYGKLSELPIISFVHIDADRGAGDHTGLRTGNTYRGENILFSPSERVIATMKSQEVDDLAQGLDRRSAHERQGPYDHIECWFNPHLLSNIKSIENGASGIRPVGRLSFFHNYRKIKETIQAAENKTIGHEQKLLKQGLDVNSGLNIFVVGSLCGGTGSGMFLDMAYCLRHLYRDIEYQLKGYLIISPELYGGTPGMSANTYAALKELNYYAAGNTQFKACWDPQYSVQVEESRPPFDFVYLTSNKTATDYKILDKNKLCNVIANKIFLDCSDELIHCIESNENNYKQRFATAPVDEHPRSNNQQTYLTFGLAKIFFPQDLTIQVALNRVKLKLVSFWLSGEGQSPDPKVLLDRFLLNWCSDHGRQNLLVDRLESLAQDRNKTIIQAMKVWQNKTEQQINNCKNKDERQRLVDQLTSELRSQFHKARPGETDSNRGAWLTLIQQSAPNLLKSLKQDILKFLSETLQPKNVDFSLLNGRNWLEAIVSELNQYKRDLEERLQDLGTLYDLEDVEKKWQSAKQSMQDIEQKKGFFDFNDKSKNTEFKSEMQNSIQGVCKLIKHNVEHVLYQESLQVAKELILFVQSLVTQASNFNELLILLRTQYEKRSEELMQLNQDDITGEALFTDVDMDAYYETFLPDAERRNKFNAISTQVTENLSADNSLINFLIQERLLDNLLLQETINATVEESLSSLKLNVVQSVIQRFLQKYPLSDAEKRMKQILRNAEPLLPLNLKASYFQDDPANYRQIIAFQQKNTREVQQFKELLTQKIGISASGVLESVQTDSEITIVNEYGAFPLRLIIGLGEMREHYKRQCKINSSFLHNDYQRTFIDPIPPENVGELQDVFFACLAFEILKQDSQVYVYEYFDSLLNSYERIELSLVWSEALEQLANAYDVTQALKQQRDQIFTSIRIDQALWTQKYESKLRTFIDKVSKLPQEDPNYPQLSSVLGERATLEKPLKEGILARLWNYLRSSSTNQSLPISNARTQIEASSSLSENQSELLVDEPLIMAVIDPLEQTKTTPSTNWVQELKVLSDLKEKGDLSEHDFESAKRKLLDH